MRKNINIYLNIAMSSQKIDHLHLLIRRCHELQSVLLREGKHLGNDLLIIALFDLVSHRPDLTIEEFNKICESIHSKCLESRPVTIMNT